MSTKIEYNGSIVATVEGSNKATIPVKDKKMATDMVVTVLKDSGGDSALPIEVATEAEMTALLESGEVGGVYRYTGETTETYENGAMYVLEDYGAELIGTWTLNASNLDFSMFTDRIASSGWSISGMGASGEYMTHNMVLGSYAYFGYMRNSDGAGVAFYEYPEIVNTKDNSVLSSASNNTWTTYSTFTINSVPIRATATLSIVLAFLQANATKQ